MELAKKLQNQKKKRNFHGLYDFTVIDLTYASSRMASVRLTRLQVETIFKKGKVRESFEPMKVSDVIEVLNHIHCVDYMQHSPFGFNMVIFYEFACDTDPCSLMECGNLHFGVSQNLFGTGLDLACLDV